MNDFPEFHPAAAYTLAAPHQARPIVLIGAGGIVRDAHLPAYRKAGYPVWGIADIDVARAQALADEYGIERVFASAAEAIAAAPQDVVYDIALMPEHFPATLRELPDGAAVLLQKPLGQTLAEGEALRDLCASKGLIAAVNTQLRFAPYVAAARALIADGVIGELYDFEIRVQTDTPWHMFPSVFGLPRLEINMHSVHYIDLVRSFLGDPDAVSAVTVEHPEKHDIANTRSTILMRYRDRPIRVTISVNHDHAFGSGYDESFIKWEGTKGAIRAQMGLLLDYPRGGPDALELALLAEKEKGWTPVPFEGTWFPDAFIGSMGAVQRFVEGSVPTLPTAVDDVLHTMAAVEAAYESAAHEGVQLNIRGESA